MDPRGTPSTVVVAHAEHTTSVRAYLVVFLALLVLTILEYVYARAFADAEFLVLVGGLVALAAVKAGLVGLFFMHLLFEGRWKYLLLIPTAFLASVVVLGLVPDIAFKRVERRPERSEPSAIAPPDARPRPVS